MFFLSFAMSLPLYLSLHSSFSVPGLSFSVGLVFLTSKTTYGCLFTRIRSATRVGVKQKGCA